jgi:predicted acetyltransferase
VPEGEPLPVAAVGEVQPGTFLLLRVQDTGAGIDGAQISRMCDPFFTTKFTGRGLGLAAVAGIVRRNQGAVLVSSTPGNGAAMTVLLPVTSELPRSAGPRTRRSDADRGRALIPDQAVKFSEKRPTIGPLETNNQRQRTAPE